jgi:hypothetical protein
MRFLTYIKLHTTAPTRNWRFSASYDSFVVEQTFVLRMNICGKNRQLHIAANRNTEIPAKIVCFSRAFCVSVQRSLSEQ